MIEGVGILHAHSWLGVKCPVEQHKFELNRIPYSTKKHLGVTEIKSPLTFAAVKIYKIMFSVYFDLPLSCLHDSKSSLTHGYLTRQGTPVSSGPLHSIFVHSLQEELM